MCENLCSIQTFAKVIAWTQALFYGVVLFFWIIGTMIAGSYATHTVKVLNQTGEIEVIEEETYHFPLFFAILFMIIGSLYFIFMFLLAFGLLRGIYTDEMKYVAWWLVAKGVLLGLGASWAVFCLFGLLFGHDTDLNNFIITFVLDALMVFTIYSFWQERKSEILPE